MKVHVIDYALLMFFIGDAKSSALGSLGVAWYRDSDSIIGASVSSDIDFKADFRLSCDCGKSCVFSVDSAGKIHERDAIVGMPQQILENVNHTRLSKHARTAANELSRALGKRVWGLKLSKKFEFKLFDDVEVDFDSLAIVGKCECGKSFGSIWGEKWQTTKIQKAHLFIEEITGNTHFA